MVGYQESSGLMLRKANREDPDQDLHCLSRLFWQLAFVQNFKTFTIMPDWTTAHYAKK